MVESVTAMALRRRVLGEVAVHGIEAEFVAACNRLAAASVGPVTLVFTDLDHADTSTLHALTEILSHEAWLRLPLVLHFGGRPESEEAKALIEATQSRPGEAATVDRMERPRPAAEPFDVGQLPPQALRYLRVAAMVGNAFESELVAAVLEASVGEVLESLQDAADLGMPLADRGDGVLAIPAEIREGLLQGVLPSLAAHWHRRLAELVGQPPSGAARVDAISPEEGAADARHVAEQVPPPADTGQESVAGSGAYGDVFEPSSQPQPEVAEVEEAPEPPVYRPDPAARREAPAATGDQARAARHLLAAGEREAAVERYLAAIGQLARRGDARRALVLVDEALRLVAPIAASPAGAMLRARLLAQSGTIRWRAAGLGTEYSLSRALEILDEAKAALPSNAPVALRAFVASSTAGVCYDLGDVRSLERALSELSDAARALRDDGDPVGAARLLNDQAAVFLRAGDPVRTTHLLNRSREVFERLRKDHPDDPVVAEELAETEHLLARLPLQARLRPGREDDAYSLATGHARAAELAYRKLEDARALARVWETLGRLEIRRGRLDEAGRRLDGAAQLQKRLGDLVGLARTAAAMSDLYAAADRPMDALALLAESITLNTEKGSPLGLAFNRKALRVIADAVGEGDPARAQSHAPALEQIVRRLDEAQAVIGTVSLPGDPGPH
jgi:tetratricopeptide (TPR) repeat protein